MKNHTMRILIIEDEFIIATDMKWILEDSGFSVIGIYPSGEEAILKAKEHKPDLILMDIMLQGKMDGIEAAKIIFEMEQVPILFCTANCDNHTVYRLQNFEHEGVLKKPLDDDVLVQSVFEIQSRRRKTL